MKIGILDIQGSVKEHAEALGRLSGGLKGIGGDLEEEKFGVVLVKTAEDLKEVSGLIIPGGESTTIGKLLRKFGLRDEIIKRVKNGMAIWGTCAGAILLAKKIEGKDRADSLGLMDIVIERNAYGRQLDSFETEIKFLGSGAMGKLIPAVFIRAPKIRRLGKNVKVLAKNGSEIVAAQEGNLLITMLHPELTDDLALHRHFVEMCQRWERKRSAVHLSCHHSAR